MNRQADVERMIDLIASIGELEGRFTEAVGMLRGLQVNDVLTTEVGVFDSNGQWTRDWNVPFGSVAITNLGSATLTVHAGSANSSAPVQGPGMARVRPGIGQIVNIAGRSLTLYGTAGEVFDVSVFTKPQPPAWGQAMGDTPAGVFTNGLQVAVSGAAVQLVAANASRRLAIVQNVGAANGVLGLAGVTATTGFEVLYPGQVARVASLQALYAIRQSADTTFLVSEVS